MENVDEPPGKPDPPTVSDETESSLTVTWTEPANTGPDVANYHVQYRTSGAFADWPDTGPSLTRTLTGLRSGRAYQIQVQAENDRRKGRVVQFRQRHHAHRADGIERRLHLHPGLRAEQHLQTERRDRRDRDLQ